MRISCSHARPSHGESGDRVKYICFLSRYCHSVYNHDGSVKVKMATPIP